MRHEVNRQFLFIFFCHSNEQQQKKEYNNIKLQINTNNWNRLLVKVTSTGCEIICNYKVNSEGTEQCYCQPNQTSWTTATTEIKHKSTLNVKVKISRFTKHETIIWGVAWVSLVPFNQHPWTLERPFCCLFFCCFYQRLARPSV